MDADEKFKQQIAALNAEVAALDRRIVELNDVLIVMRDIKRRLQEVATAFTSAICTGESRG